jgi:hypothetical protein
MTNNNCVRCGSIIERCNHPFAHYSSICRICHTERQENIYDQSKADMNRGCPYYISICDTLFGKGFL